MNNTPFSARLFSFALAAVLTVTTLAGIDSLAHSSHAANALMAKAPANPARGG